MIDLSHIDLSQDKSRSELVIAAVRAMTHSYAPYSRFKVGAALRFSDDRIFSGANIENVSYSLTMCAERVALFSGVHAGCNRIAGLAIAVDDPAVPYPCGACLQVLSEFGADFPVYLLNNQNKLLHFTFAQLLPYRFDFQPGTQDR